MLLRIFRSILSPRAKTKSAAEKAAIFAQRGDIRAAIVELRQHLVQFPQDISAINNLGCHLADVGDEVGAANCFDLAYSLDDSFLPGIVNHAQHLHDRKRSKESLELLRQAKASDPDFPPIDAAYGAVAISRGNVATGKHYALQAWLQSFDNLRFANCYLMDCAFDDIAEVRLAAEHKFWGKTLAPIQLHYPDHTINTATDAPTAEKSQQKIRIGYWSPDFRNHSVRYFFRPLLNNHDRTRFEIFLYHDHSKLDKQTENIRKNADHYFNVSEFPDQKLIALFKSHQLDILVELAGHTSANRLPLLQKRLATIQISGLGYPPTTGLSTIDAKLVDVHMNGAPEKYYCEAPLVLPSSFWCFDPYENAVITPTAPAVKNGYVTFACVGNIAKNSARIINLWVKILERVPNSKLMLRSISFGDEDTMQEYRKQMHEAGIPADRLILLKPEGGANFFASYNDIDIVLDTFPYNGGTTTCFATYMGVPVVSLAGESVISQMGKSILSNLGMSDWIVGNESDYVERAVKASSDLKSLDRFRTDARERFQTTALGNGQLFARDFEKACIALLEDNKRHDRHHDTAMSIPDLPPQELVKRAYAVLNSGNEAAAQRIIDYCLGAYPNFGAAHILWTQRITGKEKFNAAADYLMQKLDSFDASSRNAALINVARNLMFASDFQSARRTINMIKTCNVIDALDAAQVRLLDSALQAVETRDSHDSILFDANRSVRISVLIASDLKNYAIIASQINTTCAGALPSNITVTYTHCRDDSKGKYLSSAINDEQSDIIVWVNKNVSICSTRFFVDVVAALEHSDVVGFSGADIYDRLNWRRCASLNKVGAYLSPSAEKNNCFEIQVIGHKQGRMAHKMVILDGALLAFSPRRIKERGEFELDPFLESAATLMEEHFIWQCYKAGLRLATHQCLGVMIDWRVSLLSEHLAEARWHLTQKLGFDPFANLPEDRMIISAPVDSVETGIKAQWIYFGEANQ